MMIYFNQSEQWDFVTRSVICYKLDNIVDILYCYNSCYKLFYICFLFVDKMTSITFKQGYIFCAEIIFSQDFLPLKLCDIIFLQIFVCIFLKLIFLPQQSYFPQKSKYNHCINFFVEIYLNSSCNLFLITFSVVLKFKI